MSKIWLLFLLLLLSSCSDSVSGGVSEAGNGYVATTITLENASAAIERTITVVPSSFNPLIDSTVLLQEQTTNTQGRLLCSLKPGTYNLWAKEGELLLFTQSINVTKGDTTTLPVQQFHQAASVQITSSEQIEKSYAIGQPLPFKFTQSGDTVLIAEVPKGAQTISLQSQNALSEIALTTIAAETTYVDENLIWTHWSAPAPLNFLYAIKSHGDNLLFGCGEGFVIESNNEKEVYTKAANGLPSDWILDIAMLQDTIYLATDKGVAYIADGIVTPIEAIDTLKVTHLFKHNNAIWYQHSSAIGKIIAKDSVEETTLTELGYSGAIQGMFFLDDTLYVGTTGAGLLKMANDVWSQDTSFSPLWATTSLYKLASSNNRLWIGTIEQGIFMKESDQWYQYSTNTSEIPSDSIYSIYNDSLHQQVLFGTKEGEFISWKEEAFKTIDAFKESTGGAGIFAMGRNRKGQLLLGTFGSGLIFIDE